MIEECSIILSELSHLDEPKVRIIEEDKKIVRELVAGVGRSALDDLECPL
jgi:hypothetical protein